MVTRARSNAASGVEDRRVWLTGNANLFAPGSHLGCLIALAVAIASSPTTSRASEPVDNARRTSLEWVRTALRGDVTITARPGARINEAEGEIQKLAARLDCLRTFDQHVVWLKLSWRDGRIEVEARADSAIYGNVAMLAARDLFPGRGTAGSGVQQLHRVAGRYRWRVRILMIPRRFD